VTISVVIPCYNSEHTLHEAVRSALAAHEVIVVDDASPNGCADLVAGWGWPNVQVIRHVQNLGLGAARNSGSAAATGDWIAFLDADDAFEDGWHGALIRFLRQSPDAVWVYHPVREWTGSHLNAVRYGDHPTQHSDWILRRPAVAPSACALRTDTAKLHPFDTNRRLQGTEDLELWMRLWAEGLRPIRWTDEAYTRYRISHGMSAELEPHSTKIRLRWTQFVERGWIPEGVLVRAEQELQRQKARSHHKSGRFNEAQRAYLAAGPSAKNWILAAAAALHLKI
jgi:glycosyltransferase involved in cell wall biosynthesis